MRSGKQERRCVSARQRENHFSRDSVLVTALPVCRVTLPDAKQVQLAVREWRTQAEKKKNVAQSFKKKKGTKERRGNALIQQSA